MRGCSMARIIRPKSEGVRPSEIAGKLGIGRASVLSGVGWQKVGEQAGLDLLD